MKKTNIMYIMDDYPGVSFVCSEIQKLAKLNEISIFSLLPNSIRNSKQGRQNCISMYREVIYSPTFRSPSRELLKLVLLFIKIVVNNFDGLVDNLSIILRNPRRIDNMIILIKSIFLVEKVKKIDHIHCHFAMNNSTAALFVHNLTGVPFSFTTHAIDLYVNPELIEEKCKRAKFVVTISQFNVDYLQSRYAVNHDRISLIHCGVDTCKFSANKVNHDGFVILSVARLVEKKGLQYLIDCCRELKQEIVGLKCIIVGDGPERIHLEKQVDSYNLDDIVEFLGDVADSDLKHLYSLADAFVLPCTVAKNGDMDGIPVSLMEAMAMEIPVISTSVSAIPELIEDGVEGILVDDGDVAGLSNAVRSLYQSIQLRIRLGKKGREKVQAQFNIDIEAIKLHNLINK